MRKFVILGLSSALAMALASLPAVAAESPTCDEGPVTNARIQIAGDWFSRPDARIDGFPTSAKTGPFRVVADVEPSVASMTLRYAIAGPAEDVDSASMSIKGSTATGQIPRLTLPGYGQFTLLFYLEAFDADGVLIWLDEIPYSCPPDAYIIGDPYHVILEAPPFEGNWQAIGPDNARLRIVGKQVSDSTFGSTYEFKVIRTGKQPKGTPRGPVMATSWDFDDLVLPSGGFTYDYGTDSLYEWGGPTYVRK